MRQIQKYITQVGTSLSAIMASVGIWTYFGYADLLWLKVSVATCFHEFTSMWLQPGEKPGEYLQKLEMREVWNTYSQFTKTPLIKWWNEGTDSVCTETRMKVMKFIWFYCIVFLCVCIFMFLIINTRHEIKLFFVDVLL